MEKRPLYVNTNSDHPATVTKYLYKSIASRLSHNSRNEDNFERVKEVDQEKVDTKSS